MDQQLLFNRNWTHPVADRIMAVASSFDFWWPFLLVGAIGLAIFGGFRWRVFLVAAVLAVGVTDALVVDSLKEMVGRPRPHDSLAGVRSLDLQSLEPRFLAVAEPLKENFSGVRIRSPRGNSFPSGHAANNFAVAGVGLLVFRRWGWMFLLPAALVAYSRVYVGSHWPLDVVVSALIGTALGWLTVAGLETLWRWKAKCWLPRIEKIHPSLLSK
jgi:undecaprenyl-diphosphatase